MKKIVLLLVLLAQMPTQAQNQDSLLTTIKVVNRSSALASRVMKQMGDKPAHTAEFFLKLEKDGFYAWVTIARDVNGINPFGNYLQTTTGKVFRSGKLSFDANVSLFMPSDKAFLKINLKKASLIPNVLTRYGTEQKSVGLWINYFHNLNDKGSAFTLRVDYSRKTIFGKIELLMGYTNGLFNRGRVLNGGIHLTRKLFDLGEQTSVIFDLFAYTNIKEFEENPFTKDSFGMGITVKL